MIIDYKKIENLQGIMQDLSHGIDPTSGMCFQDDTILNNVVLKHAFATTSEILKDIIHSGPRRVSKVNSSYKPPFHLFPDEINKICFSDKPITISKLTHLINEVGQDRCMKKLKATDLTYWLTQQGYLEVVDIDEENPYKRPTQEGMALGISYEIRTNSMDIQYSVNFYSLSAQKFIASKINEISGYSPSETADP